MDRIMKYMVILLFALAIGFQTFAQGGGRAPDFVKSNGNQGMRRPDGQKRVQLIHIEYLKQQLKLNPAESEKFWPVFAQYEAELREMTQQRRANNTSTQPDPAKEFAIEQKLVNIRQHYHEEFLKILPNDKVNLLYKSEADFKYELLRALKEDKVPAEN